MDNQNAIKLLRHRRSTYFFGDAGPHMPPNTRARWRLSPGDPQGWHSNSVGFIEAPVEQLEEVLDVACNWFDMHRTDTWIDVDELGVLYRYQALITARGFQLSEDLDAMVCRQIVPGTTNAHVTIRPVTNESMLEISAWIAEQLDSSQPLWRGHPAVQCRLRRYRRERTDWNYRFVLAYLDDEPVGTARLTDEEIPVIVGVATVAHARHQGVATAITSDLIVRALAYRSACALYVERESQAQRIYSKLGFERLYRNQTWYRPFGQTIG